MLAVVLPRPGSADVLEFRELDKPTPADREVLVRIRAATVTRGDVALRRIPALMWPLLRIGMGLQRKRILGHEFAGEVEAVGRAVTRFHPGDPVFGTTTGLAGGSHAEYVCVPEDGVLTATPPNVTFEDAAAVPVGAMTALRLLREAGVTAGTSVLVHGASGSVGTFAVQLGRHHGAVVTGVCSTANVELVASLGAATVIDYTRRDYAAGDAVYDVVIDAAGKMSRQGARALLADGGRFVSVRSAAGERAADLALIASLLEQGAIRPVIDRSYPLERIQEAHRYVEAGHKVGNVVITLAGGSWALP
ncbi:MAG: NAD(P)-dependent alcohol dehydrogenase [Chloroflexota bacterium]|nr:MAG: NAD(P)-dependent alcohol dehydrogenase [Chloroflexota bacterium]